MACQWHFELQYSSAVQVVFVEGRERKGRKGRRDADALPPLMADYVSIAGRTGNAVKQFFTSSE